jgi:rhodanese-related sulfurtransferase
LLFKRSSDILSGVTDRSARGSLFDAFASVANALGNGRRAEIVDVLAQGERSVEGLAAENGQSIANTSQHLQRLARAGLVRSRRVGHEVRYRLASDGVGEVWSALRDLAAEHVSDVDTHARAYLGADDEVERLSLSELADRIAAHRVVLLDVRPRPEYEAGHIAGAHPAPLAELERVVPRLPAGREVVAYSRGPYCADSFDAVRLLRSRGLAASRLAVGFPEWRRAGLPVNVPLRAIG